MNLNYKLDAAIWHVLGNGTIGSIQYALDELRVVEKAFTNGLIYQDYMGRLVTTAGEPLSLETRRYLQSSLMRRMKDLQEEAVHRGLLIYRGRLLTEEEVEELDNQRREKAEKKLRSDIRTCLKYGVSWTADKELLYKCFKMKFSAIAPFDELDDDFDLTRFIVRNWSRALCDFMYSGADTCSGAVADAHMFKRIARVCHNAYLYNESRVYHNGWTALRALQQYVSEKIVDPIDYLVSTYGVSAEIAKEITEV